jgi:hypothetical protein
MYTVPDEFQRELDATFHGRFRVRWSNKMHEFHLEQKVATGQLMEPPPSLDPESVTQNLQFDMEDDNWLRARDGYFYVMSIRNGDRMPCPICGATLKVPKFETRETQCERCKLSGMDGKYRAAYFPMNHIFIQHIRNLDPYSDGPERARERMRAKQIADAARKLKEDMDRADYAVINSKTQVENNPMSGYGQKSSQPAGLPGSRYQDEMAREFKIQELNNGK